MRHLVVFLAIMMWPVSGVFADVIQHQRTPERAASYLHPIQSDVFGNDAVWLTGHDLGRTSDLRSHNTGAVLSIGAAEANFSQRALTTAHPFKIHSLRAQQCLREFDLCDRGMYSNCCPGLVCVIPPGPQQYQGYCLIPCPAGQRCR
jgi:hypothetical protein